jgi:hypothetical protein
MLVVGGKGSRGVPDVGVGGKGSRGVPDVGVGGNDSRGMLDVGGKVVDLNSCISE